jgi:hypothetical protein
VAVENQRAGPDPRKARSILGLTALEYCRSFIPF